MIYPPGDIAIRVLMGDIAAYATVLRQHARAAWAGYNWEYEGITMTALLRAARGRTERIKDCADIAG